MGRLSKQKEQKVEEPQIYGRLNRLKMEPTKGLKSVTKEMESLYSPEIKKEYIYQEKPWLRPEPVKTTFDAYKDLYGTTPKAIRTIKESFGVKEPEFRAEIGEGMKEVPIATRIGLGLPTYRPEVLTKEVVQDVQKYKTSIQARKEAEATLPIAFFDKGLSLGYSGTPYDATNIKQALYQTAGFIITMTFLQSILGAIPVLSEVTTATKTILKSPYLRAIGKAELVGGLTGLISKKEEGVSKLEQAVNLAGTFGAFTSVLYPLQKLVMPKKVKVFDGEFKPTVKVEKGTAITPYKNQGWTITGGRLRGTIGPTPQAGPPKLEQIGVLAKKAGKATTPLYDNALYFKGEDFGGKANSVLELIPTKEGTVKFAGYNMEKSVLQDILGKVLNKGKIGSIKATNINIPKDAVEKAIINLNQSVAKQAPISKPITPSVKPPLVPQVKPTIKPDIKPTVKPTEKPITKPVAVKPSGEMLVPKTQAVAPQTPSEAIKPKVDTITTPTLTEKYSGIVDEWKTQNQYYLKNPFKKQLDLMKETKKFDKEILKKADRWEMEQVLKEKPAYLNDGFLPKEEVIKFAKKNDLWFRTTKRTNHIVVAKDIDALNKVLNAVEDGNQRKLGIALGYKDIKAVKEVKPLAEEAKKYKSAEEFVNENYFKNISDNIISGEIKKEDIPSIISMDTSSRGVFKRDGKYFSTKGAGEIWSIYHSQIVEMKKTEKQALKMVKELFDINSKTKQQLTNIYNQAVKEVKPAKPLKPISVKEKIAKKKPEVIKKKIAEKKPVKKLSLKELEEKKVLTEKEIDEWIKKTKEEAEKAIKGFEMGTDDWGEMPKDIKEDIVASTDEEAELRSSLKSNLEKQQNVWDAIKDKKGAFIKIPSFKPIKDIYKNVHDWIFAFGEARRVNPEFYNTIMKSFSKRNSGVDEAIDKIEKIIDKPLSVDDSALMSLVYTDKRLEIPKELKEIYDKFKNILSETEKNVMEEKLYEGNLKERLLDDVNAKIDFFKSKPKKLKELIIEKKAIENYRYLPQSIVAQRAIESKYRSLTGEEKKVYLQKLSDLSGTFRKRKSTKLLRYYVDNGLLKPEDIDIRRLTAEVLDNYYYKSSLKDLYDYSRENGMIKPVSAKLKADGWLSATEVGIRAPELKNQVVHPLLADALNEMKTMRMKKGGPIRNFLGLGKLAQFIKPQIIWVYNALQKVQRGMFHFSPSKEAKITKKAFNIVLNKTKEYHEYNSLNLYQFPYEMTKAAKSEAINMMIRRTDDIHPKWQTKLETILDMTLTKQNSRQFLIGAYKIMAHYTWLGDKVQRTQSALSLELMGYSREEAVKIASRGHGAYSELSTKFKKILSPIVFVHSFRVLMPIEMVKTMIEPVKLMVRGMKGEKVPNHEIERASKAFLMSLFIPLAISVYLGARGFKKDKFLWKWKKEVIVDGKKEEIVVSINFIWNMPIKWWHRLSSYNPIKPEARIIQGIKNFAQWEVHPVWRIFFWDILKNRKSFGVGEQVYNPTDNVLKQTADIAWYSFKNIFRLYGKMADAAEVGTLSDKEKERQDKVLDAGLSKFEKVLTFVFGYAYTRDNLAKRQSIMKKYLDSEYNSRKSQLIRDYDGEKRTKNLQKLKNWKLKCIEWIEEDMK